MEKKVSKDRWEVAQGGEKKFWDNFDTEEIRKNHEEAYKKEIEVYSKRWSKFIKLNEKTKILQIGCGPLDIINYLEKGELHSVDPLADFYKKKFNFDYKKSNLVKAQGEKLPYKNGYFDLVILENVLDHTSNPEKVLSESKRVLKEGGILHFECAFYQRPFLWISKIWGPIKELLTKETFNIHHPHMWSLKKLKKLVKKYFITHRERIAERINPPTNNLSDLRKFKLQGKLTQKIPAMFWLLGNINYSCICTKR